MVPESQQYTAFTIGNIGFYEFTHMPFGLCNTQATFQCLMQNMLGELNLTYCICICIVFERFCEFNLNVKPSKCLGPVHLPLEAQEVV